MSSEVHSAGSLKSELSTDARTPLLLFRPYIPAGVNLRELTVFPLIVGTLLGIIFGASSLYLVLKVGLTVSASIPVAVISITLFRLLSKLGFRDATILENNIVQTAGSAGESIAFGVGVTMPAILILGFDLEFTRIMLVAVLGGLLGILMMIPLRRALIVKQHGFLKYPEGAACAEVLKAGASEESKQAAATFDHPRELGQPATNSGVVSNTSAKTISMGFGIGFIYYAIQQVLKSWSEYPTKVFGRPFEGASIAIENNPALLGVGYIIGPRIAALMFGGGVLSYLVLIPAIKYFGSGLIAPLAPEQTRLISEMSVSQIQQAYILYIGAGAVAAGGIISLIRSLPIIWSGLKGGLTDFKGAVGTAASTSTPRTDRDLSMKIVVGGIIAILIAIMVFRTLHMNLFGALLIIICGFLFVTVSSRLTGEVGSTSNPISGMTVATLLLTSLVFLLIGWTAPTYFITALSIGGIVCVASSNGGITSQDLKTGFLIGATPKYQQIAILIGALASALLLGPILLRLDSAATVYVPVEKGAFAAEYKVDPSKLEMRGDAPKLERIEGPQASTDSSAYHVWFNTDTNIGPDGRYLVDAYGTPVYLVDPGINGKHLTRPDGSTVTKYLAPKATLMSYIIKGILNQQLPWGLVLLGVLIAVLLELSGIPTLAFAVGVYLPISTSCPIYVGGLIRMLVDRHLRKKLKKKNLTEDELNAEADKSPGVLLASGYVAGGALAGIVIAFMASVLKDATDPINTWSSAHNPFFNGPYASALSLIPFAVLVILLFIVGREWWLAGSQKSI